MTTQTINTYTDIPHGGYASYKEYYENNKGRCYLAQVAWVEKNRERVNEYSRQWKTGYRAYCEVCDHEMRKDHYNRHCQSKKHQDMLELMESTIDTSDE